MAGALETLQEVRERLGDLPSRMVDILRQQEPPLPATPATMPPPLVPSTAAAAVNQVMAELPQPTLSAGPSFVPPGTMTADMASFAPPDVAAPAVSSLAPVLPSASALGSLPTPMPATGRAEPSLSGPISGGSEVVSLLRQLVGGGESRAEGRQRSPRTPPPRGQVVWSHVWQPSMEGFAGGASPSVDVSNIAGTGGASSRRGLGSYGHPGRYWQPEGEGIPR